MIDGRPGCEHAQEPLVPTETSSLGLDTHARNAIAAPIDGATSELIRKNLPIAPVAISEFVTDLDRGSTAE